MIPTIQILGLRKFTPKGDTKERVYDAFFKENWRASSVADIFADPEKYLAAIPVDEKWNLYYTAALCTDKKREIARQEIIPFDIDGIDLEIPLEKYVTAVCQSLDLDPSKTGAVYTGNGIQIIVGLLPDLCFTSKDYFQENKHHYQALCIKVDEALRVLGLPGKSDPVVFSPSRILRMPGTENRKPKGIRHGRLLQGRIEPVDFDIRKRSGLPETGKQDAIPEKEFKRYPKPDTEAVLDGCNFLKHCKENPKDVKEAQWYASLSVLGRLEDGGRLCHDYSKGHPSYTTSETEDKIRQATSNSGPRTCDGIGALWDGCQACPNYGKVNSPISIRGPETIKTETTGFHEITFTNAGVRYKPSYGDLRKFFSKQFNYKVMGESKIVYKYNGKFYTEMADAYLEGFAHDHFNPTATNTMCAEFRGIVQRTHLTDPGQFDDSISRKINFQNGVLDLSTRELLDHSPEFLFRYCLNYDYDGEATAPVWDKFLDEITLNDSGLKEILLQYMGYCLSNDSCWAQKALILDGEGENGKSTFMNILRALAGKDNYGSLTLSELRAEGNRQLLDGKLFNLAEETPSRSLMESSIFKNLVSGGETTVRQLYKKPYTMRNRAKLLFACNELPKSSDTTQGYFRRFIIVPFRAVFSNELGNVDPFIEKKLMLELPGIFNQALAAYFRLTEAKRFQRSDAVDRELLAYKHDVDTSLRWITERVTDIGGPGFTPLQDLYQAYAAEIEAGGEEPVNSIAFGKKLGRRIKEYESRLIKRKIEGKTVRGILGIEYQGSDNF